MLSISNDSDRLRLPFLNLAFIVGITKTLIKEGSIDLIAFPFFQPPHLQSSSVFFCPRNTSVGNSLTGAECKAKLLQSLVALSAVTRPQSSNFTAVPLNEGFHSKKLWSVVHRQKSIYSNIQCIKASTQKLYSYAKSVP